MVSEAAAVVEAEEAVVSEAAAIEAVVSEKTLDLEKCTRQFVLSAARTVKSLSSQQKENLFFARIALERKKDFDFLDAFKSKYFFLYYFYMISFRKILILFITPVF